MTNARKAKKKQEMVRETGKKQKHIKNYKNI